MISDSISLTCTGDHPRNLLLYQALAICQVGDNENNASYVIVAINHFTKWVKVEHLT